MSRRITLFILLAILLAALVVGGLALYPLARRQWTAPLGPELGLPTRTATTQASAAVPGETQEYVTNPEKQAASENRPAANLKPASPTPKLTPTPAALCGGPPLMTVLALGADSGQDYRYGLADVIRIARIDFVTPKVSVLSMPRDLWVEIPDISEKYGITHGKLNQAYFYGSPGMGYYDEPGAGPGLLARTLDLNFGLAVEHYGAVNMQTFVKIVDALGGIDLYLPNDVDGRSDDPMTVDLGYFYAGQHHFTGEQALAFARIRKRYNDFTRMDHQTMVICALREKITSPAVIPKIPQIIQSFVGSVQTDLSLEQLSQLACLAPQIKRENLLFTSLPEELFSPGRMYNPVQKNTTFVLEANYDLIREYIARFMNGTWPTEPEEPACP